MDAEPFDSLLPDLDHFEQQVVQADLDRDPFAVALFEIKPAGNDYSSLMPRLARCLLDFASPSTHVASVGRGRLAILARTDDTTHRWIAPVGTALQDVLDEWLDEVDAGIDGVSPTGDDQGDGRCHRGRAIADLVAMESVPDLIDRPRLVSGAARGLTQQVWLNAEAALAKAHTRRLSFVEHRGPGVESLSIADRRAIADPAAREAGDRGSHGLLDADDDDRLVVLSHRIEPVGRAEPEWLWLRLQAGLQPLPGGHPQAIDLAVLDSRERAMLEIWLAARIGPLFAGADAQLRVTLPITAEAARARSFAQRIFPILEHHRIPPSRLVLEIDIGALVAEPASDDDPPSGSQPSVRRFIEDAATMDVAVVVTGFDGGWASWRAIHDLPVSYIAPHADLLRHAGGGDADATRSLGFVADEAGDRGIELIVPDVETRLSAESLAHLGFSYRESPISMGSAPAGPSGRWSTSARARSAGS